MMIDGGWRQQHGTKKRDAVCFGSGGGGGGGGDGDDGGRVR